ERMRRVADGVRRSGRGLVLELGPLGPDDMKDLVVDASPALGDAIIARSEGNPFFAEELLVAAGSPGIPHSLPPPLLRRVSGLDGATQSALRVAAAAGREVAYPLLRATASLPEPELREALRAAVEHRVLIADQTAGRFRFRHALLAEAI